MKNRFIALLLSLFIFITGSGIGAAANITVHNGESIQAAVDNATHGDTIIVEPGIYYENVTLSTYDMVIMSQSGNPEDTTIQGDGFYLTGDAQEITIKGFTLKGTDTSYGINLAQFSNCVIEKNKILNYHTGIDTNLYSTFTINDNEISNCESGVFVGECYYGATVKNNRISNCGTGVIVGDSGNSQIENNTITENDQGISLLYEGRADIAGNTISFNNKCGIYDKADASSKIYNNYFNNTVNVIFDNDYGYPNVWNTTRSTGKNIIDGPYIAGNYWAKPNGTGFSQTHYDENGDGIAEETVKLSDSEIDYAALTRANSSTPELPPASNNSTTNSSENVTEPPEEIVDNSSSSDGVSDNSSDDNSDGSSDDNSDDSSDGSSGSSHSSGSSGGGGGSPEPQTNVEVKELSQAQVLNGKPVMFDFEKNATCVVYVSFDAKKNAGKITAIAEQLKGKSTLVSELDSGEVYKYFNLWVGNSGFATSKNIENPELCFKVEKSWLQDKKTDQNSIMLNSYSDKKWSQLPVTLLKEDDQYLYFTAQPQVFSFFAITGKATTEEAVNITQAEPNTENLSNNTGNNTGNETTGAEQTSEEESKGIPGFEMIYGIIGLTGVYLLRRK
ncbi:PGF-pre-PGF domain-containing protein [Methanosarcina sp. DH1]|uniref:PGF-pre-PGF domain-containing protein n=1 Tax=Methanosarcina sp. DH1 TaxID=2605695 RepID=UPI001E441721|nr:PGF-pre-PGF domain-containing protein [Methanosarcina sp. DH1]MCC4768395.1 PGF-pre-PGF domain-containing protein [Methanosarcina sp. DH1]